MRRRTFTRVCSSLLAAAAVQPGLAARASTAVYYNASRLLADDGLPLLAASVTSDEAYVFHYPFVTTPCFLIRLPAASERGDTDTLAAYSAICTHKLTHPSRPISHISYRADPVSFRDDHGDMRERAGVISCCSERSVYDASNNAAVLAGPARAPLPRIILEIDANDEIRATGSQGPDRYEEFIDTFGFRLAMEHGITDVRARAGNDTTAQLASTFSRQQVHC